MPRLAALALVAATVHAAGPCDILGAAGNPCVAAHSTVRALYAAYSGPLYNITRSDGVSFSVPLLKAGGFADKPAHDAFCPQKDCVISNVFDQSPNGNHLGQRHGLVNASQHPITVMSGSVPVYGMWFDPGFGYHVDKTTGIATGNASESIYAVLSGTHFNGGCCFDYGNSESNDRDDGDGTMEAIYFGNAHWRGNTGFGSGPWVGADLEQGMYYGGGASPNGSIVTMSNTPLTSNYVTTYLRGRTTGGFMLKGGDATQGSLKTMYDGQRPFVNASGANTQGRNYQPPKKQGAIILATGGDNSNGAMGCFYEGVMVTGETTDATDDAVQANIVAVGYSGWAPPT